MSAEHNLFRRLFDRPNPREVEIDNQARAAELILVQMLAQEEFKGFKHLHSLMVGLQHVLTSSSGAYQSKTIIQWDSSFASTIHSSKDISNPLTKIEYEDGTVDRICRLASLYRILDDCMVGRLHVDTLLRHADLLIMLDVGSQTTKAQMADLLRKRSFHVVESEIKLQNLHQPLPENQSFEFTERRPSEAAEVHHFARSPVLKDVDDRKRSFFYSSMMIIPQAVQGKLAGRQDPIFGGAIAAA